MRETICELVRRCEIYCLSRSLRKSSFDFASVLLSFVPLLDVFVDVLATVAATFFCTTRGMNDNRGFWSLHTRKTEIEIELRWKKKKLCISWVNYPLPVTFSRRPCPSPIWLAANGFDGIPFGFTGGGREIATVNCAEMDNWNWNIEFSLSQCYEIVDIFTVEFLKTNWSILSTALLADDSCSNST